MEQMTLNIESSMKRACHKYSAIKERRIEGKHIDQGDEVFTMLFLAAVDKRKVPLTDLLHIASHTGRISELRSEGWDIKCHDLGVIDHHKHTEYELVI